MIDSVKKYLREYRYWLFIGVILTAISVLFVMGLVDMIKDGEFDFKSLFGLVCPFGAFFTLSEGIKGKKSLEKDLENNQELIFDDFEKSNEVLGGKLRLGMVYIFGKHSSRLGYTDREIRI